MAKLKVDIVTIGYGDSGTLDEPVALRNGKLGKLSGKLSELLLETAESFLLGGWENNEGACGEIVLNIKERSFTREHDWRVTEYVHEEEEILL